MEKEVRILEGLRVREFRDSDLELLADYWCRNSPEYMTSMGVDLKKIPAPEDLKRSLGHQLKLDYKEKSAYGLIAEWNGKPIGHCNLNPVEYGNEGRMHLHLWNSDHRKKGLGKNMVLLCLPIFFKNFDLKRIWCDPYALNEAPNRALASIGFEFMEELTCTPGWINFEQRVKRWKLERADWERSAK